MVIGNKGGDYRGDGKDTSPQHFGWGDAKVNVPPLIAHLVKFLGHIFHLDKLDYCISGVTGVSMHCFPQFRNAYIKYTCVSLTGSHLPLAATVVSLHCQFCLLT